MSVAFLRGQQLGTSDLDINLENASSYPINAAEISYALYDFTTGQEVLLGIPRRDPVNDSVGHYYASVIIPLDANIGDYRVRWSFRETVGGPIHTVVQEFNIVDRTQGTSTCVTYNQHELEMVRRLRILLRDNCVGGEELIEVDADGTRLLVSLQELWEIAHRQSQREKVKTAWLEGKLNVLSVSPEGKREWKKVLSVTRAEVSGESIVRIGTSLGKSTFTGGHRIFTTPKTKIEAEKAIVGTEVLGVQDFLSVTSVERCEMRKYMYDLTVEDWHNFVLPSSGMVVSNSPDRNYHFRPPAHEETIRQFNQVFGFIWENEELAEYLQNGLDMVSAAPPRTPIPSIDILYQSYPEWRTLVLNGAMMYAFLAMQANWVVDEFDYSIGGISLSIEKSSKYESLYQAVKDSFDNQLEKAKATVKIVKGLQQPRFGQGVRSAFGPYSGAGILSPRKFVGF